MSDKYFNFPFLLFCLTWSILIIHLKSPLQFFLRWSTGSHICCKHELLQHLDWAWLRSWYTSYLEINASISIIIKNPKNLINKDQGIPLRQDHGVHLQHLLLPQLTIGAVLLKSPVMIGQQYWVSIGSFYLYQSWLILPVPIMDMIFTYTNSGSWFYLD